MASAVKMVKGLTQAWFDWWGGLNVCEVTGAHDAGLRRLGALAAAVISYSDWPEAARNR